MAPPNSVPFSLQVTQTPRASTLTSWQSAPVKSGIPTLKLEALTSEEDGVKSKEKYSALTQFDRNFTEHSYMAIVAQQERARFSGYTYQSTVSVNYGLSRF